MLRRNLLFDPFAASKLFSPLALPPLSDLAYARKVFDQIPHPNLYTWNTLICGYASAADPSQSLSVFVDVLLSAQQAALLRRSGQPSSVGYASSLARSLLHLFHFPDVLPVARQPSSADPAATATPSPRSGFHYRRRSLTPHLRSPVLRRPSPSDFGLPRAASLRSSSSRSAAPSPAEVRVPSPKFGRRPSPPVRHLATTQTPISRLNQLAADSRHSKDILEVYHIVQKNGYWARIGVLVVQTIFVITNDGRNTVGVLKGFDQATNIILDESHERVYSTTKGMEQLVLGLYIIRANGT